MQKFIIPHIISAPAKGIIRGQDAKHIFKVLRLNKGDMVSISNGRGKDFSAAIVSVSIDRIDLDIFEELSLVTESPIHITLCSGMLKDNKMDLVIKYVTQLGIGKWIPFFSERSIPTPDAKKMQKRYERWETIARESLKQCQRSRLPAICLPMAFETLLTHPEPADLKIAFFEKATTKLSAISIKEPVRGVFILIGPEGGFSGTEMDQAEQKGFLSCSLGPRILRAETASIVSSSLIQHLFGDM